MERRRIIFAAGLALVLSAALLPLVNHAKAQSVCCNDVKFPERYHEGGSGPALIVVDGERWGSSGDAIQHALDYVARNGTVLIKPAPGGYYDLGKEPLFVSRPVTIASADDSGVVRIHAEGPCVIVNVRPPCGNCERKGEGGVTIKGLAFESEGQDTSAHTHTNRYNACIVVERANTFQLSRSSITMTASTERVLDRCVFDPSGSYRPLGEPACGYGGVRVLSGKAKLEGNSIRRTGTAIALLNATGDAHSVTDNYIAGNGVGVYAGGGTQFRIEDNGIFRNHNIGVDIGDAVGSVNDNDIEDNWTGLKILPPSAFSAEDPGYHRGDVQRDAQIVVRNNLVTQYGVYRPNSYDLYHDNGNDKLVSSDPSKGDQARYGYAIDFALDSSYINDNVYDYPKRGSILSGIDVQGNCFFGPATSLFDRDRFTRVIAPSAASDDKSTPDNDESTKSGDHKPWWYIFGGDEAAYRNNSHSSGYKDALTPLWFADSNTWVEHLDYDAVDKIDHENAIESPLTESFHGGLLKAIHNWFARNKREMTCGGRHGRTVVSAPGDWPRFDTNPIR